MLSGNAPACTYNGVCAPASISTSTWIRPRAEAALTLPLGALRLTAAYTYSDREITQGANKGQPQ